MIKTFICDVDGCLNDGVIYWAVGGKPFKAFGNYDHDGIKMLRRHLDIQFISADRAGWPIMKDRIVKHMGCKLHLVSEADRYAYVSDHGFDTVAYMGDGFYDAPIIQMAALGIAPAQGRIEARNAADYVCPSRGGEGAVMDACLFIMRRMGIKYEL
jgi:3-deoxy-D-manno-octulosonate 8-phosphate phosphatase (KDO 8-P phosphatase)